MNTPMMLRYQAWLESKKITPEDKLILQALSPEEIDDAFFKDIEFGTAGMRGILGPGTNRINQLTIQKTTVAFGLYLQKTYPDKLHLGVVIAHDNRHQSDVLTDLVCQTLNTMGITAHRFDELKPTPLLSYAVRQLQAIGGIMLTASHNPKEYHGFKIYDHHGCQLVPYRLEKVMAELQALPDFLEVNVPVSKTLATTLMVPTAIESKYLQKIQNLQLNRQLDKHDFSIVYSPQHGCGYRLVPTLFHLMGYRLHIVKEQAFVDANFSGTQSPNPEEPIAYEASLKLAEIKQADLVLMSDPDADRVGLAYKDQHGQYQLLNGNVSAALLLHYMLEYHQAQHTLPINAVVYDTIVCSPLAKKIAQSYGLQVESFLTGFKFIGDRIQFYQEHAGPRFFFGYEESYGCLIGDFVRDKDALQALTLYAEMTLYYKSIGYTLDQVIEQVSRKYGYHGDEQHSVMLKGEQGQKQLTDLMMRLRLTPFKAIGPWKVVRFDDYLAQVSKTSDEQTPIALPQANVLKFYLQDGSTIIVRPSGTESKCKFYYSVVTSSSDQINKKISDVRRAFELLYHIT
jgi:phosphoglucomutase